MYNMLSFNTQDDIKEIKENIKNLIECLRNMKDKADSDILEQLSELTSVISDLKGNNSSKEKSSLLSWCSRCGVVLSHPIQNIAYALAAYTIFNILFRKNK